MKWRPEKWEELKKSISESIYLEPSLTFEDRIIEASADAILNHLEETGYPYDDNRIRNLGTLLEWFAQVAKGKRGCFVFLPEAAVRKNRMPGFSTDPNIEEFNDEEQIEKESQERVKRIFEEIDQLFSEEHSYAYRSASPFDGVVPVPLEVIGYFISVEEWKDLKAKEGVE